MAGRAASGIPGISAPRGHAVGAECSKRPGKREVSQRPFRENFFERHHGKARRPPYRGPREWFLASSTGSFVNPANIAEKFQAEGVSGVSRNTVAEYVRYMEDAFLFQTAKRFDIRGKDYLSGQRKHYFSGLGLRNARLNYRQFDRPRLLENAVYNELASRGYSVDVGRAQARVKNAAGKLATKHMESDFVVHDSEKKMYIQVAEGLDDSGKKEQEMASLLHIRDGFPKYILVDQDVPAHCTESGIRIMSIPDFLLKDV